MTTPAPPATNGSQTTVPSSPRPERPAETSRGEKGRRTAERILDVAEEVFADRGFEGATLRDVANRVGVRIPSLYNHFDSKESLYAAVLERGIGPLLQSLAESAVDRGSRGQPEDIVRQTLELLAQRPNLPRLVLHETLGGGRHLRQMLHSWLGPLLAQANQLVAEGPAATRWNPDQLPYLVLAMYNIVVGYFAMAPLYRDLNDIDLLSPEALAQQTDFLQKLSALLFGPDQSPQPNQSPQPE
jgi:AcrR family transcriptional regulator